jgi:hypothetical protein
MIMVRQSLIFCFSGFSRSIAIPIVFLLLFSSCATIFTGSRQSVTFDSNVPETRVSIHGIEEGNTPVLVNLKKGFYGKLVTFEKEGYETKTIELHPVFNPVAILNLTFIVGWAIDAATGAMMKYDRIYYKVTLEKTRDSDCK